MDPVEIVDVRQVTDLDTARVLMEPSRLAILRTLSNRGLRQLTVKQIAEELDEGQTKLYRHIKQLEEYGLIHVAETRVVSGIIEKRYMASQKRLSLNSSVLGLSDDPDDFEKRITTTLDSTRDFLNTELRAGRIQIHPAENGPDLRLLTSYNSMRLEPGRYARLRAELTALLDQYYEDDDTPEAVPVMLQALLFAVVDPVDNPVADQAPGQAPDPGTDATD
jgi:DNA-binding transcriptional ArsR family regulator